MRIDFAAVERLAKAGIEIALFEEHIAELEGCGSLLIKALLAVEHPIKGEDERNYIESLHGDFIEEKKAEFYEAVRDYFPKERRRLLLLAFAEFDKRKAELIAEAQAGEGATEIRKRGGEKVWVPEAVITE